MPVKNIMQSIIAESGDVAETTGEKIATIIRHQQNVSVNFIETISESTLLKQEKRRSRQSLLSEFANEGETAWDGAELVKNSEKEPKMQYTEGKVVDAMIS